MVVARAEGQKMGGQSTANFKPWMGLKDFWAFENFASVVHSERVEIGYPNLVLSLLFKTYEIYCGTEYAPAMSG